MAVDHKSGCPADSVIRTDPSGDPETFPSVGAGEQKPFPELAAADHNDDVVRIARIHGESPDLKTDSVRKGAVKHAPGVAFVVAAVESRHVDVGVAAVRIRGAENDILHISAAPEVARRPVGVCKGRRILPSRRDPFLCGQKADAQKSDFPVHCSLRVLINIFCFGYGAVEIL